MPKTTEEIKADKRKYYHDNKESVLAKRKTYYYENQEHILAQSREYTARTRSARKVYNRKHLYGITAEDFDSLILKQNSKCPICLESLGDKIAIDHDHATGAVRGILHNICNLGLGCLGDSWENMLRATNYLRGVHNG